MKFMRTLYSGLILATLTVLLTVFVGSQVTFGSDPQPVIQKVNVHDVTDFTGDEREDRSNLINSITPGSGSNVLNLSKSKDVQEFRYDFIIVNEGDQDWDISNDDELFHDGIDTGNWTINTTKDAWYRIKGGTKKKGGQLIDTRLDWDTSGGGTLPSGEKMNASYIFETDQNTSENYNQTFRAENTNESSGSEYEQNTSIILRNPGKMNVTLYEPPEDTRLQVNKTFEINSTVECYDGECGDVNLSARYNETDTQVDISETYSDPFYSLGSNPKTCKSMEDGDKCNFNWVINATGVVGSNYSIDTEARSSIPEVENNQSEKKAVNIDFFLIVSDSRNTTTFGSVDPNSSYNPALGNSGGSGHEITVDNYSQPVDSLYLQVDNLTSYFTEGYRIGPSNLSYSFENDTATSERATGDFDEINQNIQPGETVDLFYWLDVPSGIVQDYYNGTATFVAASDY